MIHPGLEEEERSKLISRIQALEKEFRQRTASREADKREVDEVAADEVLDEIETRLRNVAAEWESDSDDEKEIQEGDAKPKDERPILTVLRYARTQVNKLSTLTILVRNDSDVPAAAGDAFGHHETSRDVLVDTVQGMTFRSVLELVCEYWGINPESTSYRLVDERGTWHRLDSTINSAIRPSRREHPVLFLQRRKGIDEVLRGCEYGAIEDFGFDYSGTSLAVAPVVSTTVSAQPPNQQLANEDSNRASEAGLTKGMGTLSQGASTISHQHSVGGGVLSITRASEGIWKKDEILFTWRRVACDFLLALTLFIILCVYLALAPQYTAARGVSMMITNSLINVNFYSPPLGEPEGIRGARRLKTTPKDIIDWQDFWSWMQQPVTNVLLSDFFPDRHSVLFGPVRLRQNRVRPVPCKRPDLSSSLPCYPVYSAQNALTNTTFAGTNFLQDGTVPAIFGLIADYPANGYVVDIYPNVSANSVSCPLMQDSSGSVVLCGIGSTALSNESCWDCAIRALQNNSWADEGSRLITVQFLVYNGNANLFIDAQFAFELSTTGYIMMTYEIRAVTSSQSIPSSQRTAFVVVVSLLITVIGVQFLQGIAYIRRVYLEARSMDPQGQILTSSSTLLLRICWTLPTRFTIWNPIIFGLCVTGLTYVNEPIPSPMIPQNATLGDVPFTSILSVGNLQTGEILLGVANLAVAYKLSTYFHFTSRFLTYFQHIAENLFMLCVAMTLTVCSFAWLLTITAGPSDLKISTSFGESFVLVVRLLLNQVSPEEFYAMGADMWFPVSWVFYASQIVLNLLLVRIAAPICYHALKREDSAADYVIDSLRQVNKSIRRWAAT